MVEELFLRACLTAESLEDHEARFFTVRSAWPKYARDFWDAYQAADVDEDEVRFVPTPADLSVMLDALALGRELDRRQWKIVADVAHGFSWEAIGDRRHMPVEAAQRHYGRALDAVVAAAMADRALNYRACRGLGYSHHRPITKQPRRGWGSLRGWSGP